MIRAKLFFIFILIFIMLFVIYSILLNKSLFKKDGNKKAIVFVFIFGLAIFLVLVFYDFFYYISVFFSITRTLDIFVYMGFLGVCSLLLLFYVKLEKQSSEITRMIRYIALNDLKIEKKNTKDK